VRRLRERCRRLKELEALCRAVVGAAGAEVTANLVRETAISGLSRV
jgi:hypothetical protein